MTRIVLNSKGIRELLRGPEVTADLERRARQIATAAGNGHRVDSEVGPNRARSAVITDTEAARRNEARSGSLTRAIDAGRE